MEYVILDLEWDSVFYPPKKRFINQILQIGAVQLNDDFNIIDTAADKIDGVAQPVHQHGTAGLRQG